MAEFGGIRIIMETPDLLAFSCGCTLKTAIRKGELTSIIEPCRPGCPVGEYMIRTSVDQGQEIEFWTAIG